jgi:ribosomal protein S18 acetylase RimI-like enzyme
VPNVRRAVAADSPSLAALAMDAYQPYVARIGRPPAPMAADYAHHIDVDEVWLTEEADGVVGLLVLRLLPDHLLLDNVAVATTHRGRGLGAALIAWAERRAGELGYSEVRLYTNEQMSENIGWYGSLGYRETHRGTEAGFRRVYFSKKASTSSPRSTRG